MNKITTAGLALALAAGLIGGLATSASASAATAPGTIHGTITGLHSIRLDPGFAALKGEVIKPQLPGYGSTVTVTSVSGPAVALNGTFLPLNTKGADVAFSTISGAPAPMTIAITGITSSKATATTDYVAITTTPANGIPLVIFVDGVQVASPVTVAPGSTHSFVVKLVDPGNVIVATSNQVTATAKVFTPPQSACFALWDPLNFSGVVAIKLSTALGTTIPGGWVLSFDFNGTEQIINSYGLPYTQTGQHVAFQWDTTTQPIVPNGVDVEFQVNEAVALQLSAVANFAVNGIPCQVQS
jgi:hypothetical protein